MINFTVGLFITLVIGYLVISGCINIIKSIATWFASLFKKGGKK